MDENENNKKYYMSMDQLKQALHQAGQIMFTIESYESDIQDIFQQNVECLLATLNKVIPVLKSFDDKEKVALAIQVRTFVYLEDIEKAQSEHVQGNRKILIDNAEVVVSGVLEYYGVTKYKAEVQDVSIETIDQLGGDFICTPVVFTASIDNF